MIKRSLQFSLAVILICVSTLGNPRALRPSEDYRKFWADIEGHPSVFKMALARHRKLVAVGDTLYLLKRNRILWSWVAAAPLWDEPVIDSKGMIYVVGYDMLWAAVDSRTGERRWSSTANGRGAFTQIKPYHKDMYFVITDMWGYRDSLGDPTIKDTLSLCRNNAVLWDIDIPAQTKLHVLGNNVILTYKRHGLIVRQRIPVPRAFGKPISRISSLADYDGKPIVDERQDQ